MPEKEKKDPRVERFEWWHEAVFGDRPFKESIPHKVLRAYLDYEIEANRARKGIA